MKIQISNPILRDFFSQLRLETSIQGRKYLPAVEKLLLMLDAEKEYPFDFIVYRLTGKRFSGKIQDVLLNGKELIRDLQIVASQLSEQLNLRYDQQTEPVYTVAELARRFSVSDKTIRRWQRRGLHGRIYLFEKNRKRLGFAASEVDRFCRSHPELIRKAGSFTLLDDREKQQIIEIARQIQSDRTFSNREPVIREVSARLGRSRETVRSVLARHDRNHPQDPVFRKPFGRLTAKERSQITKLHQQGVSSGQLAHRFGVSRSSVHRITNQQRAKELSRHKMDFMDSPDFHMPDAADWILHESQALMDQLKDAPKGILNRSQETALFRRYNYLKFLAQSQRSQIRPTHPSSRRLHQIEQYLQQAEEVKNLLVEINMPLVVSIAGKHLSAGTSLADLISEGNVSLMRAVEKFDYTRGYRFSTYANLAIAKDFARKIPAEASRPDRAGGPDMEHLALAVERQTAADFSAIEQAHRNLRLIIQQELDEREQYVILCRYPLEQGVIPQKSKTLKEIGDLLGLSKERVRQIELQALQKLRHTLSQEQFDLLTG